MRPSLAQELTQQLNNLDKEIEEVRALGYAMGIVPFHLYELNVHRKLLVEQILRFCPLVML